MIKKLLLILPILALIFTACKEPTPLPEPLTPELQQAIQTVKDIVYPTYDTDDSYFNDMVAEERIMPLKETSEYKTMVEFIDLNYNKLTKYEETVKKPTMYIDKFYYGENTIEANGSTILFSYHPLIQGIPSHKTFQTKGEAFAFIEKKRYELDSIVQHIKNNYVPLYTEKCYIVNSYKETNGKYRRTFILTEEYRIIADYQRLYTTSAEDLYIGNYK